MASFRSPARGGGSSFRLKGTGCSSKLAALSPTKDDRASRGQRDYGWCHGNPDSRGRGPRPGRCIHEPGIGGHRDPLAEHVVRHAQGDRIHLWLAARNRPTRFADDLRAAWPRLQLEALHPVTGCLDRRARARLPAPRRLRTCLPPATGAKWAAVTAEVARPNRSHSLAPGGRGRSSDAQLRAQPGSGGRDPQGESQQSRCGRRQPRVRGDIDRDDHRSGRHRARRTGPVSPRCCRPGSSGCSETRARSH